MLIFALAMNKIKVLLAVISGVFILTTCTSCHKDGCPKFEITSRF